MSGYARKESLADDLGRTAGDDSADCIGKSETMSLAASCYLWVFFFIELLSVDRTGRSIWGGSHFLDRFGVVSFMGIYRLFRVELGDLLDGKAIERGWRFLKGARCLCLVLRADRYQWDIVGPFNLDLRPAII